MRFCQPAAGGGSAPADRFRLTQISKERDEDFAILPLHEEQ